ncbi:hypothetical protein ABW19_dt0208767 [Dactylella cylindrospora]|nr:hypothetical protein ABW19_dt0208767 [Dactylella cylindrospora]
MQGIWKREVSERQSRNIESWRRHGWRRVRYGTTPNSPGRGVLGFSRFSFLVPRVPTVNSALFPRIISTVSDRIAAKLGLKVIDDVSSPICKELKLQSKISKARSTVPLLHRPRRISIGCNAPVQESSSSQGSTSKRRQTESSRGCFPPISLT